MALSDDQETKLVAILEACEDQIQHLNDWERNFLADQQERYQKYKSQMSLTAKQWTILDKMMEKVQ